MDFGLSAIDYTIVVVYLIITFSIGFLAERIASKDGDAFFLGGRKLPWWALGASGMASNVDIGGTAVAVALIYVMGVKGFFVELRGGIVLVVAILLAFMGKWNRRSGVMTRAEWMVFRFGDGPGGRFARIVSALSELLFTVFVVSFFALGLEAFVGPLNPLVTETTTEAQAVLLTKILSAAIVLFVGIYSMAGGLTGVVWTDVFQGVLILIAVLFVCTKAFMAPELPDTFAISAPVEEGFNTFSVTFSEWVSVIPSNSENFAGNYSGNNAMIALIGLLLFKVILDGISGSGGYMIQRYLAAKSEREAGLISALWTFLLMFRWPMVVGFVILGVNYGIQTGSPIEKPDEVLGTVISQVMPVGIKGLLVAGFLAAFMSTLSSFLNSSAAYWVQDIYKPYLNKDVSPKGEVWQGRFATMFFLVGGYIMAYAFRDLETVWSWLTVALTGGIAMPMLMRWYWWRINGEGFAVGTIIGNAAALCVLVVNTASPGVFTTEGQFWFVSLFALFGVISATLITKPTDQKTLDNFYFKTRPFGFWKVCRQKLNQDTRTYIFKENRNELFSLFLAIPWQLSLFIFPMLLMLKQWSMAGFFGALVFLLTIGLYFFWYRQLSPEGKELIIGPDNMK